MSRAIAAAVGGDTAAIGPELTRLRDAGVSPIPLLRGLVRRLMTIAALRAETDAGGAIDAVMERNRVFFREKTATTRAVRTWSPERIAAAHVRKIGREVCRERGWQEV